MVPSVFVPDSWAKDAGAALSFFKFGPLSSTVRFPTRWTSKKALLDQAFRPVLEDQPGQFFLEDPQLLLLPVRK